MTSNCKETTQIAQANQTIVDPNKAGAYVVDLIEEFHSNIAAFCPTNPIDSDYLDALRNGRIPPNPATVYSDDFKRTANLFENAKEQSRSTVSKEDILSSLIEQQLPLLAHSLFTQAQLFTHVYDTWVKDIARAISGKKILEIGAGRYGLLSHAFQCANIDSIATDPLTNDHPPFQFHHVERLNHEEAIKKFSPECDVLLVGWAEHAEWTKEYTQLWKQYKPTGMTILIGEYFGCCGTPEIYEPLKNDKLIYSKRLLSPKALKINAEIFDPA